MQGVRVRGVRVRGVRVQGVRVRGVCAESAQLLFSLIKYVNFLQKSFLIVCFK